MSECVYNSAFAYIESAATIAERILKIDAIIMALEDATLQAAAKSGIEEYQLDDGQVKIKTTYRNIKDIEDSIAAFEKSRQRLINRITGSAIQMRSC